MLFIAWLEVRLGVRSHTEGHLIHTRLYYYRHSVSPHPVIYDVSAAAQMNDF